MKYRPMIEEFRQAIIENGIPPTSESLFCGADLPPSVGDASLAGSNEPCLDVTRLVPCLAPDHSGLEANILRFDNPLQAARRCSTFPTDE